MSGDYAYTFFRGQNWGQELGAMSCLKNCYLWIWIIGCSVIQALDSITFASPSLSLLKLQGWNHLLNFTYTNFYFGWDALPDRKSKLRFWYRNPLRMQTGLQLGSSSDWLWGMSLSFHVAMWASRTASKAQVLGLRRAIESFWFLLHK